MNAHRPIRLIGIPLFGKGATTHLHRKSLVDAFLQKGWEICYLIREDYVPLLEPLPGCQYEIYRPPEVAGDFSKKLLRYCQQLRRMSPPMDQYKRWQYQTLLSLNPAFWGRIHFRLQYLLSGYRSVMDWLIRCEGRIYRKLPSGLSRELRLGKIIVLGVGSPVDTLSLPITWWAIRRHIPVINLIGNYDSLSSNGFRGHPIEKILVWGPNMEMDARKLQGIPDQRIRITGSIRYNEMLGLKKQSRTEFFHSRGLNPKGKTITFAGFYYEFHYFEMLSVFKEMKKKYKDLQLIVRIYPNKRLLRSPLMEFFIEKSRSEPGVYLSLADPFYLYGDKDRVVLQIEEVDLWNILNHSDVVINIFSTIAVEACIFDKPVIHLWYFEKSGGMLKDPIYRNFPLQWHIQRLLSYGVMPIATNRMELMDLIEKALSSPGLGKEGRKKIVEEECGPLDGRAAERVVAASLETGNQLRT
jgi:hypothetical protein